MKFAKSSNCSEMNEDKKVVEVDEEGIRRIMSGGVFANTGQIREQINQTVPEPAKYQEAGADKDSGKKKRKQADFEELFLKDNRLSDRRMVYVSKDTYEKLVRYISIISDRKLSIVGYVDNIVAHHIDTYKGAINELYESRIGCKLFHD